MLQISMEMEMVDMSLDWSVILFDAETFILFIQITQMWTDAGLESKCLEMFTLSNTPGTRGGPGGCDRTLDVKRRKKAGKSAFFV